MVGMAAGGARTGGPLGGNGAGTVPEGTGLYRVWGGKAGPNGSSWTNVNPSSVSNYRNMAGLPNANSGRFVTQGVLKNNAGVIRRSALPLNGNAGGLPEIIVPNPGNQIQILNISEINPPF